jgi:DNA-binding NarL/FixJ family response regulator
VVKNAPHDHLARVVLADRSALVRAGLRVALEMDSQVEVVGEARDGRDAAAKAHELQADLLVLDTDLPEIDGWSVLQLLQRRCPKTRVLLLGTLVACDFVRQAREAGVAGYVPKAASLPEVRSAVREALTGDMPVDQHIAHQALARVLDRQSPGAAQPASPRLTAREIQVIERVARGRTNREIGAELVITSNTVRAHIEHILAKLDARDRTQAAVRAVELGYLRGDANHAFVSAG